MRWLALLLITSLASAAPLHFYLLPDSGSHSGHPQPSSALAWARNYIRGKKAAGGLRDGAIVEVRKGTYYLPEPLEFGVEDSGTESAPIIYRRYGNEKVVIKGSRVVKGWEPFRDGIWRASLATSPLLKTGVHDVFYLGKRQPRARIPNVDPKHPRSGGFLYVDGVMEDGSKSKFYYNPDVLDPAKWAQPELAQVTIWSWLNWNLNQVNIKRIDTEKHIIELAGNASYKLIRGNRLYIDNVFEELDAPGEWYFDRPGKALFFLPPDGKAPERNVTVAFSSGLIVVKGDRANQTFAQHLQFDGFELGETGGSAVILDAAAHCKVTACTVSNTGGVGIYLTGGAHHNRVAGCDIHHCRAQGIVLNGRRDWSHSLDGKLSHNVITNNHVYQIGDGGNAWAAIQINPGCGGNCTHDNVISHNLVHDTPRQGIRFDGMRNIVEYNRVHHTNQEQSDTGAIGMGSRDIYERGSIVRYNYVSDTGGYNMVKPGVWEYPHYCWGIYLDDYTSGVHVYGNLCVRTYRGGVMVHGGQDNIIENNIIVDGTASQLQLAPIDSLTSGRTKGHPDTSMWLMTGTVIRHNIFRYDAANAYYILGKKYEQCLAECDRNLFWPGKGEIRMRVKPEDGKTEWETWQKMGYDQHSIIDDPLFVNPEKDDYRLRDKSPALALGFKPIPIEEIGLHESDERASWPVPDDCWREEHLTHPGGLSDRHLSAKARRQTRGITPALTASAMKAPTLDGIVAAGEYPGKPVPVMELSMADGAAKRPTSLWVGHDANRLYVALTSTVADGTKLTTKGGTWGQDDGAEVCLQLPGDKQPVFIVQGYPSGKCESVTDAGAPAAQAAALGKTTRYAARIQGNQWTGEWAIPWTALGATQTPAELRFNVGLLKGAEKQWAAWVSTGAAPWNLDRAGKLELR
jgi:hypothetical protein